MEINGLPEPSELPEQAREPELPVPEQEPPQEPREPGPEREPPQEPRPEPELPEPFRAQGKQRGSGKRERNAWCLRCYSASVSESEESESAAWMSESMESESESAALEQAKRVRKTR
jgi:hypothetical protein